MDTIKRTLSGIPNIFTIVFSGNTASGTALCNKTWQEVLDAYNNGDTIVAKYSGVHGEYTDFIRLSVIETIDNNTNLLSAISANTMTVDENRPSSLILFYINITFNQSTVDIRTDVVELTNS